MARRGRVRLHHPSPSPHPTRTSIVCLSVETGRLASRTHTHSHATSRTGTFVSLVEHVARARLTAARATSDTPPALTPAQKPLKDGCRTLAPAACTNAPKMERRHMPGRMKQHPAKTPPATPCLMTPMAMATCVEAGPGKHCPSARSSIKTECGSHRRFSTHVFSKKEMCAIGPPKAVKPRGAKHRTRSKRVASAYSPAPPRIPQNLGHAPPLSAAKDSSRNPPLGVEDAARSPSLQRFWRQRATSCRAGRGAHAGSASAAGESTPRSSRQAAWQAAARRRISGPSLRCLLPAPKKNGRV